MQNALGLKAGLRGEKPATNCLSYGADMKVKAKMSL
jgi:hypothetical protein